MIDFELLFDKLWVLFKVHYFALRFKIALAPFFEMAILLPLNCFCLFFRESVGRHCVGLFPGSLFCFFRIIDLCVYAPTNTTLP